jgi:hypothetical protein
VSVSNPRRITLADAVRLEFERTHPNGKNTLLCVGLCRRRKDREDFRETPWHGRAASCKSCETFPGPAGRTLWQLEYNERREWELEQAREKLRAWQRYAHHLRFQLLIARIPKTADAITERERPFVEAIERRTTVLSAAWADAWSRVTEEIAREQ